MEAPPSNPIKPELRDSFMVVKQMVLAEMDSLRQVTLTTQQPVATTDSIANNQQKEEIK